MDQNCVLELMEQADWVKSSRANKFRKKYAAELSDLESCNPALLAEALYYCKSYNNRFAKEILTRTGLLDEFLKETNAITRTAIMDTAADRLDILVF